MKKDLFVGIENAGSTLRRMAKTNALPKTQVSSLVWIHIVPPLKKGVWLRGFKETFDMGFARLDFHRNI
jgi:hypothetical protein